MGILNELYKSTEDSRRGECLGYFLHSCITSTNINDLGSFVNGIVNLVGNQCTLNEKMITLIERIKTEVTIEETTISMSRGRRTRAIIKTVFTDGETTMTGEAQCSDTCLYTNNLQLVQSIFYNEIVQGAVDYMKNNIKRLSKGAIFNAFKDRCIANYVDNNDIFRYMLSQVFPEITANKYVKQNFLLRQTFKIDQTLLPAMTYKDHYERSSNEGRGLNLTDMPESIVATMSNDLSWELIKHGLVDVVDGKVTRVDDSVIAAKDRYVARVKEALIEGAKSWDLVNLDMKDLTLSYTVGILGHEMLIDIEDRSSSTDTRSFINMVEKLGLEKYLYEGLAAATGGRIVRNLLERLLTGEVESVDNFRANVIRKLSQYCI